MTAPENDHGLLAGLSSGLEQRYVPLLDLALKHHRANHGNHVRDYRAVGALLYQHAGRIFPEQDTGMIAGNYCYGEDVSYPVMMRRMETLMRSCAGILIAHVYG